MFKHQIIVFLVRWLISSSGMWLVINLFGQIDPTIVDGFWFYAVAGLIFSLVNSIVRPIATIFSLPLIILSMGVFTLIINTAMMALTIWLLPGVKIDFIGTLLGTLVISLINSIMNVLILH